MEINLLEIQEPLISELKRLTKDTFNLDEFISTADELKYTREIKRLLGEQLLSPSEEFIRFFAAQVYTGKLTHSVREQFSTITKRAFTQFINERINERLKSAMTEEISAPTTMASMPETQEPETPVDKKRAGITTTEEELNGYYIVKAILRDIVDPKRIFQRDTHKYFGILLDDTNRKPICRLYFNSEQKYMTMFNSEKNEEKCPSLI